MKSSADNKTVYVYREHNYGLDGNDDAQIDVCGDLCVCSTLEKATDIVFEKIKERCGPGSKMARRYFISETNMRPDFPKIADKPDDDEIRAVIQAELEASSDTNSKFYIRLYPDYPDNETESLAYVIERKTIDDVDIF